MNNLNQTRPDKGQWILYIAIAKKGGHQQAQLCCWNESFDEFFNESEDEYDTFWVEAKEPGIALLNAQIAVKKEELAEYNRLESEATDELSALLETRNEVDNA